MKNQIKLTRRGKVVIAVAWLIAIAAFTTATSNVCWTGHGYGACHNTIDASQTKETQQ